jgi:hypothetical protein
MGKISGEIQKSGIPPVMRLGLSEPLQKNKSTCWRSELEIKTGEFLFLRKHRDNLQFVYLSSFGVF